MSFKSRLSVYLLISCLVFGSIQSMARESAKCVKILSAYSFTYKSADNKDHIFNYPTQDDCNRHAAEIVQAQDREICSCTPRTDVLSGETSYHFFCKKFSAENKLVQERSITKYDNKFECAYNLVKREAKKQPPTVEQCQAMAINHAEPRTATP